MKYTFLSLFIAAVIIAVFSCNKAANPTAFSFTVSGTDVSVDSTYAQLYTFTTSTSSRRQIQILAYSGGKQVIEILALAKLGAQNALTECNVTYFNNGGYNSSDVYIADIGGVNFTTCDTSTNIIQGTFGADEMVNSDSLTKNITNGKIYIDHIEKF